MEATSAKKKTVANYLSKDEERIRRLSETLEKSGSLTSGMVGILDSFEGRLHRLDKTIMPVYEKTKQLTQLQENVDQTLTALDRVIGYYHIVDELEPKLKLGPAGNIDGYLKILDKLRVAVDFFRNNNPNSLQRSAVNATFDDGIRLLEREFIDMVRRHSQQVPLPDLEKLLKLEAAEELAREQQDDDDDDPETPLSSPKEKMVIQNMSDDVVKELNTIAKYVVFNANKSDIMVDYSTKRSYAVGRSLKAYMDAGSPKKPTHQNFLQRPSPAKRISTKRKENMPAARGRTVHSSKFSSPSLLTVSEGVSDEQLEGSSVLKNSAVILLRLLQSEWSLMEHIVPTHQHKHVFAQLVVSPIDYFMHKGELLHQNALRQLNKFDFVTIVPMLKVIKQVDRLLPEYGQLLGDLDSPLIYARFPELVGMLEKTAVKGMEDYVVYIKGDSEKHSNLPKDGTVHELTSNTMWFFEQMLVYADTAGRLEMSQGGYSVHEDEEGRRRATGSYIVRALDALTLNMENKSHSYESPILAAIFLMNNYHFIQETFKRNKKMLALLEIVLPDIEENYNTLIGNQRRAYQRGFTKLLSYLGSEKISKPISKGQRQRLKDKFKGFNTELEELYRIQQNYSIPNSSLRQSVRTESANMITLAYTPFHEEFSVADFTKNKDKYVKYRPEDVELKISKFFDQGAE